jgi:hypothetical protein
MSARAGAGTTPADNEIITVVMPRKTVAKTSTKSKVVARAAPTAAEIHDMRVDDLKAVTPGLELRYLRDEFTIAPTVRPFAPLLQIPIDTRALAKSAKIDLKLVKNLGTHLKMPNIESGFEKLSKKKGGHAVPILGEIAFPEELYAMLKPTYSVSEKSGNLPLYFVVYNPGHLSLFVLFGGTLYSLGLGYQESIALEEKAAAAAVSVSKVTGRNYGTAPEDTIHETISMAALYNQDDVIIGGIDQTTKAGLPYRFPLASMGFFTKTHADRILAVANQNIGSVTITFDYDMPVMQTLPLTFTYSKASNQLIIKATGGGAMNCTSFLEYVFAEKMSCVGAKGGYVFSHPLECRSYAPLRNPAAKTIAEREADLNERFKQVIMELTMGEYYTRGTFDYLNFEYNPGLLSKFTFGLLGGKRKTRKLRK